MPFTKVKGGKFRSPSGRLWSAKQVRKYYATGGFKKRGGSKRRRKRR